MTLIYFLIAITASSIGAVSGIGGGIIIKPVMDAISGLNASTISFLSGCTVLTMALSSYVRGRKNIVVINYTITSKLALGAALGGVVGKTLFSMITENETYIQSVLLLLLNVGVFIYVKNKQNITTLNVKSSILCLIIGFSLGLISSFLGIGGGPINIVVLYYFFSMSPKMTTTNSLFIILFSQLTSLATTIITNSVPSYNPIHLIVMCIGGMVGALIGSKILAKINENIVERFFLAVLTLLIFLNVYNTVTIQ